VDDILDDFGHASGLNLDVLEDFWDTAMGSIEPSFCYSLERTWGLRHRLRTNETHLGMGQSLFLLPYFGGINIGSPAMFGYRVPRF
jgi:hypothetical protein